MKEYVYLGHSILFRNCNANELNRRISIPWQKYWGLKEIMRNRDVKIETKKKIYDVVILPSITLVPKDERRGKMSNLSNKNGKTKTNRQNL